MPFEHVVIVGFGCIGQAVLPLISRGLPGATIHVVDRVLDAARQRIIERHGLRATLAEIGRANAAAVLGPLLGPRTCLLNLAPSVCSRDLIALAQSRGACYLDTGIEPWDYQDGDDAAHLSNHALRRRLLDFGQGREALPTALVAHGANPGFVSVLVKQALLHLARHAGHRVAAPPARREQWAALAHALDVRVIQVAEHDSQRAPGHPRPGEFANTWSAEGFITECLQDAELGWGTHETVLPAGGYRHAGDPTAIGIARPGHEVRVRSWSPAHGPFDAWLITHNEAISIAGYLDSGEHRPTVYYAYRPCPATRASMRLLRGRDASRVRAGRILKDEITDGMDELGVLLMSGRHGALWHGSQLSAARARALAPYNSATSLQVAGGIVAGMRWIAAHPRRGVLESDALDASVFADGEPWWSPMVTCLTDWTPAPGSDGLRFGAFVPPARLAPHPATLGEEILS